MCCKKDFDCRQGDDCPHWKPVEYHTGWDRLDNMLNALANGAAILGLLCVIALVVAILN